MEDLATITRLLANSGIKVLGADSVYLRIEDPSCVVRSFQTFLEHAWIVLLFITGILLAGWAWAMIRGSKNTQLALVANNLRNLLLIFGTISAVPIIVNTIYGGDLIGQACKTVNLPLKEVQALLDLRKAQMERYDEFKLYEDIDIYDSGIYNPGIPYAESPLSSSGTPGDLGLSSSSINTRSSDSPSGMSARLISTNPKQIEYTTADGKKYIKKGGTPAWRNNNPGNIKYCDGRCINDKYAIGTDGTFVVFPDFESGINAVKRLLRSNSYNNLTIAATIDQYAPKDDNNNTAAYQLSIKNRTGFSLNTKMSDLTDAQLDILINAIHIHEGYKEGTITYL